MQSYMLGEAADLVRVTEKTLRAWFIRASIDLDMYSSQVDGRGYAIPLSVLRQLAKKHGREIGDSDRAPVRRSHHKDSEKAALRAEIARLKAELVNVHASQASASHVQRAAPLQPVMSVERPVHRPPPQDGQTPYLPDDWQPLPSWGVENFGWSSTGLKGAITEGRVACHKGRWKWGPSGRFIALYAVDPEQQATFRPPIQAKQHVSSSK